MIFLWKVIYCESLYLLLSCVDIHWMYFQFWYSSKKRVRDEREKHKKHKIVRFNPLDITLNYRGDFVFPMNGWRYLSANVMIHLYFLNRKGFIWYIYKRKWVYIDIVVHFIPYLFHLFLTSYQYVLSDDSFCYVYLILWHKCSCGLSFSFSFYQ